MRAMPSPTDSTVPTSETCASASKLAIWSRMTREISAARISIVVLAFHRGCETVEFGADRGVDLLAAQLDDDSAENVGIDSRVDGDVAAGAGPKLCLERGKLVVVERTGGDDFRGGFAPVIGREAAEGADHVTQFVLAAIPGKDAKEVTRDRIEAELRSQSGKRFAGFVAADQRARNQLGEILRIEQRLAERIEAVADRFDLPLVAGKVEQSGGVAPR